MSIEGTGDDEEVECFLRTPGECTTEEEEEEEEEEEDMVLGTGLMLLIVLWGRLGDSEAGTALRTLLLLDFSDFPLGKGLFTLPPIVSGTTALEAIDEDDAGQTGPALPTTGRLCNMLRESHAPLVRPPTRLTRRALTG
jgi:hypothetical protein